ncbi:MAG TPA: FUSC family protein [Alphaproteobacteria bacterium]|nr:FUSC family protein [Alphaproteobacteria bacterium]
MDVFKPLSQLPGLWRRNRAAFRRAVRTTVAALVTYALASVLDVPQGYWAVFTSIIVVQASVGGTLQAALDYLIGTIGGAIWGAAAALLVPHADFWSTGAALAVAVVPLALAAALHQSFRVAPITAVIVLLVTHNTSGPLQAALERVLEIGLGSLVGVAVSFLVLPARAHGMVAEAAGQVLALLAENIRLIAGGITAPWDDAKMSALETRIRAGLQRIETMAAEADRERANHLTDERNPEPIARTLRRLRNDLVMVSRALGAPLPEPFRARLDEPVARIAQCLADCFATVGVAIARRADPPSLEPVTAALAAFRARLEEVRHDPAFAALSAEDASRIFGLGFALEQLGLHLEDLVQRAAEFMRPVRKRRFFFWRGSARD